MSFPTPPTPTVLCFTVVESTEDKCMDKFFEILLKQDMTWILKSLFQVLGKFYKHKTFIDFFFIMVVYGENALWAAGATEQT